MAREPALRVVPLRRRASCRAGRERVGRGVVIEHGVSPSAAVREPLGGGDEYGRRHSRRRSRVLWIQITGTTRMRSPMPNGPGARGAAGHHQPRRLRCRTADAQRDTAASYGIRPRDHVLDIGCGAGQTTRDAARLAVAGSVVGVDISAPMIDRARRLTEAAGLHNVEFEQADAESHHFSAERFDVAISRFGTMFFTDPVAGFTNIARALRPDGRLVMMVWQDHHRNEWSVSIQRALAGGADVSIPSPGAPDPFSLADPTTTERVLETRRLRRGDVHRRARARLLRSGCRCRAGMGPWLLVCERRAATAGSCLDGARPRAPAPDARGARRRGRSVVRLAVPGSSPRAAADRGITRSSQEWKPSDDANQCPRDQERKAEMRSPSRIRGHSAAMTSW